MLNRTLALLCAGWIVSFAVASYAEYRKIPRQYDRVDTKEKEVKILLKALGWRGMTHGCRVELIDDTGLPVAENFVVLCRPLTLEQMRTRE